MEHYFAPGKLLLTGEYAVLRGAHALSIPTQLGQTLSVKPPQEKCFLHWLAYTQDLTIWLEVHFDASLKITQTNSEEKAQALQKILQEAQALGASFSNPQSIETRLEFNQAWGLGSSSTLVALVAQWLKVPAMPLFFNALSGSGYDVATALAQKPILYNLKKAKVPQWQEVKIPAIFKETSFVYLGKKQNSANEVSYFKTKKTTLAQVQAISALSRRILQCQSKSELIEILTEHETITGQILERSTVKTRLFPDFEGTVKSLGAWGGDFIWVVTEHATVDYFTPHGYAQPIPFAKMVSGNSLED